MYLIVYISNKMYCWVKSHFIEGTCYPICIALNSFKINIHEFLRVYIIVFKYTVFCPAALFVNG